MLFETLTGSAPFVGDAPIAIAYRHVNEDVPPPSTTVADLPDAVDEVVLRATERDPDARYGSAGEMQAALRGARVGVPDAAVNETRVVPLDDAPTTILPRPTKPPKVKRERRTAPVGPRPPRGKRGLVIALVVALVLAAAGTFGWWYGSGRYQDAPNLLNSDLRSATSLAEQNGVEVTVGEGVFSDLAKGLVADQDPDPGARIREGGTVTLHLSKGPRIVPDVAGKTVDEAIGILSDAGIEVSASVPQNSIKVAKDRVIGTDPTKGSELRGTTSVRLLVSAGPRAVAVPDVVGDTENAAVAKLHNAGLKVVVTRAFDDDAPVGQVIGQDPAKGTAKHENDTVTITVSKGPEFAEVPNIRGDKVAEARQKVEAAGFEFASRPYRDFGGGDRCFDQDPARGSQARKGSTVTCFTF